MWKVTRKLRTQQNHIKAMGREWRCFISINPDSKPMQGNNPDSIQTLQCALEVFADQMPPNTDVGAFQRDTPRTDVYLACLGASVGIKARDVDLASPSSFEQCRIEMKVRDGEEERWAKMVLGGVSFSDLCDGIVSRDSRVFDEILPFEIRGVAKRVFEQHGPKTVSGGEAWGHWLLAVTKQRHVILSASDLRFEHTVIDVTCPRNPAAAPIKCVSIACEDGTDQQLADAGARITQALARMGVVDPAITGYPGMLAAWHKQVCPPPPSPPPPSPHVPSTEQRPATDEIASVQALSYHVADLKTAQPPADAAALAAAIGQLKAAKVLAAPCVLAAIADAEASLRGDELVARMAELERLLPPKQQKQRRAVGKIRAPFDRHRHTEGVLCQRKIANVLLSSQDVLAPGEVLDRAAFGYYETVSPATCLAEGEEVFFTEKVDGTTAQATNKGVFKRFDRKKKKGKDWHTLSAADRYTLERVDLADSANKYIALAVKRHMPALAALPDGLCVYFEVFGPRIGARFASLADAASDIRVFDTSTIANDNHEAGFLSFEETIGVCKTHDLPIVPYQKGTLNLARLIAELKNPPRPYADTGLQGDLEGYVVRSSRASANAIGKIRFSDMKALLGSQS